MLASDLRALQEKYQQICEDTITEDVIDEVVDELVDELIEEGYGEDEAYALVEEATDTFIVEAKVTFGHDTTARRASGAPVGARRKYGKRKAGEALKGARKAAGDAVETAKRKAVGAVAGAQIAGSIAKDEARRAGRAAQHSVAKAADTARRAPGEAKKRAKSGIKGFIKRQAEKVVKRMSEGKEQLVERPVVILPGKRGYVATGPLNKDDKKVSGLGPIGTYSAAKPVSGGGKKTTATMRMQNNSNELEGEQLDEFLGAGAQKAVDGATKRIQGGLERMGVKINRTPKPTARPSGQTQNTIRQNQQSQMNSFAPEGELVEEYDAYDIVLEYLLSDGHATSVEEAHHIMTYMDGETIQSIVENVMKGPLLPGEGRPTYPAGSAPKATGAKLPKFNKGGTVKGCS